MMKRYKIYSKVLGLALAALTFAACADTWDDHYNSKGEGMIDASLWQAINENSNLSNFASVVKACGYDKSLNGSQVFTVFAPTNDKFSANDAQELIDAYNAEKGKVTEDDNTVIKEFIQNHIAMYNHSVAPSKSDSLVMMNGKNTTLSATSFGSNPILSANQHYTNGVLFTIQGKAKYFPTVFEYLRKDADLDSIANFFYNSRFYRKQFVPGRSVAGGIENGKTVYLDSVFVQQNDLWDYLWAYTNEEDSTYWMVVPTNKEWKKLIEEYEAYFNYDDNTRFRDSMVYTLPRMAIVDGTTFSRTMNPDAHLTDSALSTSAAEAYVYRESYWGNKNLHYYQFGGISDVNTQKPYAPTGIFNSGVQPIDCSNGIVWKSDDWKINKLNTFYRWIIVEAEAFRSIKEVSKVEENKEIVPTITAVTRDVMNDNKFHNKVWSNEFVEFVQNRTTGQHSVTFNIEDVLSNIGYDIYLVTAPALANDSNATAEERLATKLDCYINYHNQQGETETKLLVSEQKTNPDIVDYILLAEDFKFPTASFGLNESEPQVTLTVETNVSSREQSRKQFTRTMRIDCIMLVPHGISNVSEERFEIAPHGDGDSYFWLKQ